MFELVLAIMVVVVIGALLYGRRRLDRPGASTIFCPDREMLVEVRGDECHELGTRRLIGPSWRCSRDCLRERELAMANGGGPAGAADGPPSA